MKLKIGVIGSGEHFTRNIYPVLTKNPNVEIAGILSTKKNYLNLICYNEIDFYKLNLDFVYIATPSKTHRKFIIKSLKENINVLCEKPFCDDIDDFKKIKNLAKNKNLLIFECFMYRFHPIFYYLKNLIFLKKFGKIKFVNSAFTIPQISKKNKKKKKKIGGGFFLDLGVYLISLEHYLFKKKIKKNNFLVKSYKDSGKISLKGNIFIKDNFSSFYNWGMGTDYNNFIEIIFEKAVIKINRFYSKNSNEKSILNIYTSNSKKVTFKPMNQFSLMFEDVFKNYKSKSYKIQEVSNIENQLKNILKFKNEF